MPIEVTLPYNGLTLDRAGALRSDPSWVDKIRSGPDARTVVFWRDTCLVAGDRPVEVPPGELETVFLGRDGDAGVFAADLSSLDENAAMAAVGADAAVDIRRLFPMLSADRAAILAYARGILHWHRNQRFCGACGGATDSRDAGHLRVCGNCGKLLFPRIEPAVIVLVEGPGERCLLARHRGAAAGSFSTLAGFVEIGECLEDAVRRELFEEAGVRVSDVRYQGSQAWPFPAGLMIGFRAVAASDKIAVDDHELAEARWFTRAEVVEMLTSGNERSLRSESSSAAPGAEGRGAGVASTEGRGAGGTRSDSIEHFLVGAWLSERDNMRRR